MCYGLTFFFRKESAHFTPHLPRIGQHYTADELRERRCSIQLLFASSVTQAARHPIPPEMPFVFVQ